jgi:hypothetical protein
VNWFNEHAASAALETCTGGNTYTGRLLQPDGRIPVLCMITMIRFSLENSTGKTLAFCTSIAVPVAQSGVLQFTLFSPN